MRTHCECGRILSTHPGPNWGDWKCWHCGASYCQDCGAVMWHDGCSAFVEQQEQEYNEESNGETRL